PKRKAALEVFEGRFVLAGWAEQGSNLRHPVCKTSALPLSYPPGSDGTPPSAMVIQALGHVQRETYCSAEGVGAFGVGASPRSSSSPTKRPSRISSGFTRFDPKSASASLRQSASAST